MIAPRFAVALAVALLWTTAFSMTNQPVRGLRNLGILACYIIGLVMFFKAGFKDALATWVLFGLIGGGLYFAYDLVARPKTEEGEEKPKVSLGHFAFAQLAWPIMGPEAIEYTLAELGVLKPAELPTPFQGTKEDSQPDDGQVYSEDAPSASPEEPSS